MIVNHLSLLYIKDTLELAHPELFLYTHMKLFWPFMKKCLLLIILPFQKSNNPGHNLRSLSPIPDCSSADERDYDITPRRGHPKVSGFFFTNSKRKGKKVSCTYIQFNMCPSLIKKPLLSPHFNDNLQAWKLCRNLHANPLSFAL